MWFRFAFPRSHVIWKIYAYICWSHVCHHWRNVCSYFHPCLDLTLGYGPEAWKMQSAKTVENFTRSELKWSFRVCMKLRDCVQRVDESVGSLTLSQVCIQISHALNPVWRKKRGGGVSFCVAG